MPPAAPQRRLLTAAANSKMKRTDIPEASHAQSLFVPPIVTFCFRPPSVKNR